MNASKAITLQALKHLSAIDEAVIESLDQMLYRLIVKVDGEWLYVTKNKKSLLSRKIFDLQKLLVGKDVGAVSLLHRSAYDEMIGLDTEVGQNTLTVPLGIPIQLLH